MRSIFTSGLEASVRRESFIAALRFFQFSRENKKMIKIKKQFSSWAFGLCGAALLASPPAHATDSVSAGVLTVERPTLMSAGFDWRIAGDDNDNAKVEVAYRKKGDQAWKTGLPPLRRGCNGECV